MAYLNVPLYEPALDEVYIDGKRHYKTPEGNIYPSMTTVLSRYKEPSLKKWRDSVGAEKADQIRDRAATFGSVVHNMCEAYMRGEDMPKHNHFHMSRFKMLQRVIDTRIDAVYGLECALYSNRLKVAGRTDVIGLWDNVPSVIDWKNSTKPKKAAWIDNYFMQGAGYSCMWAERTKDRETTPRQIVVVVSVEHEIEPQIFIEPVAKWIGPLENVISQFGGATHDPSISSESN